MLYKNNDKPSELRVPDLGATAEQLHAYREKAFSRNNILRVRRLEEKVRNIHYTYDRQWIEIDRRLLVNGSRGYVYKDVRQGEQEFPRPVTNFIAPAVNTELAALGRTQLTANVIAFSRDPRAEAAARKGKDVLEFRLKELGWADIREHFTWLTIVCGLSVLKSYWDETSTEVSYMQNPEARQCMECGATLSKLSVNPAHIRNSGVQDVEGEAEVEVEEVEEEQGEEQEIGTCPQCGADAASSFAPVELDAESAQGKDFFGRTLGTVQPKGQTALEVVSLFDYYPEQGGIGVDWKTTKLHRQATPRSIDWILTRYPHLKGKISAEEPRKLMQNHPVLGEWDIAGRYDNQHDADLFPDHAMVYEVWQDKNWRFPQGRGFVLVGDCEIPAYDGVLYKKVEGSQLEVPLVQYAGANWEPKHLEIWGRALPDSLISPQNRVNMLEALRMEAIGRTGSPNLLLPEACNVNGVEWFDENLGKVIRYQTDPLNPQAKPTVLEGVAMPPDVSAAMEQAKADMQLLAGPNPIEQGEAPKNITTTSGLQLLGENSQKKRDHRERALISAFEKVWQHQLDMLRAFRVEPDSYEAEAEDGSWEMRQFTRDDLIHSAKVQVEKQAEVDKSIYQKEATREAMADQLYDISTPHARKRILELRGLPTDVNEDINYQIENAKKQWVDFVEEGLIPTIDPSIDDPAVRFQAFATMLQAEEGQRISEAAGWPKVLKAIPGWEAQVQQMEAMDAAARQFYGTEANAQQIYPKAQADFEQAQIAHEQESAATKELVQEGGSAALPQEPVMPPQPPPPPVFLPGDKADHIYGVWLQMLGATRGPQMDPSAPGMNTPPQSDTYLRFRAVVEAYRMMAEERALAAQMQMAPDGQPIAPDAAGGVPNLGQLNVADKSQRL